MRTVETNGRTLEEAVQLAAQELGVGTDAVEYEVEEEGSKGFLGLGGIPAKVKAWVKEDYVPSAPSAPAIERQIIEVESEEEPEEEPEEVAQKPAPPAKVARTKEAPAVVAAPVGEGDAFVDALMRVLDEIVGAMDMDAKPVLRSVSEEEVSIEFVGSDVAVLIGKQGQTLDALQYPHGHHRQQGRARQKAGHPRRRGLSCALSGNP